MGLFNKKASVAYGLVISPENLQESMPYKRRKFKASKADKIYKTFLESIPLVEEDEGNADDAEMAGMK